MIGLQQRQEESQVVSADGLLLRDLVQAGFTWLEHHREQVNALNVFPVPDGDTGTNMWQTMRSAVTHAEKQPLHHVGEMADKIAYGALMGARGNSGVILSQIWRGFARTLRGHARCDVALFAEGLQSSADTAYKGVMTPVEGTILTVIRAVADSAQQHAPQSADLNTLLQHICDQAKIALANTPNQLPILKQAGVVDSGGQGLLYILEGMLRWLNGERQSARPTPPLSKPEPSGNAQALARPVGGEVENPYDVQYILLGKNFDVEKIRRDIDAMGDSTVVVGDSHTVKVHIHVKDPGIPLSYGVALGALTDVVVENMQEQMEDRIAQGVEPPPTSLSPLAPITLTAGQIGVVAVAPGEGFAQALCDLGVTYVVSGGQTNNPSTEELFQAVQAVPTDKVIILPNNKNIIMAAQSAADLSPKTVVVIPTRTVPQGLCAMLSYQTEGSWEEVVAAMSRASQEVMTAEFTTAVRDVTIDGVEVGMGHTIAIVNGKLCASGETLEAVLPYALAALELDERELITIYYGEEISRASAEIFAEHITALNGDVTIELLYGGQPYYHYILGVE